MTSDDPHYAGKESTPPPIKCEFCGQNRYTVGYKLFHDRVVWSVTGLKPCECPQGQREYERIKAEREAKELADEKAERDKVMRDRVKKIIGESGLGERFLQRTFDRYIADTPETKEAASTALGYAKEFDKLLPKRDEPLFGRNGLLITGGVGTGKTHIASAIANYLMAKGTAVICMTERNLFGKIQATFAKSRSFDNGQSESMVRRIYETVPLLIIDDLGKEKASEWTLSTLYAIIDGRYDKAMPIIITTNYDAKNLVERLTPIGGDKTTAEAIVDRLNEMCSMIEMTGDSWRTK